MKKLFLVFILLFFIVFVLNKKIVHGQTPAPLVSVPGASCGNAEATEPAALKCCQKINLTPPSIPSILLNIPGVGDILNKINQSILTLNRAQNVVPCVIGYPTNPADPNCTCLKESQITPSPILAAKKLCEKYITSTEKGSCESCANNAGVWTSIGCVYGDFSRFVTDILLGWGIGLAGIIALLCIIYSAFQMQTSRGNPEKIKKSQELLTSCILGLMLIIFSIFILRLIGVSILKIPGFGN